MHLNYRYNVYVDDIDNANQHSVS